MTPEKSDSDKECARCAARFQVCEEDRAFLRRLDVPEPTHCPACRVLRRLMFQNERSLYRRTCELTGKVLISGFHPDVPIKVYDAVKWWGGDWSAHSYGRDFDFSRSFFAQFAELLRAVPYPNLASGGAGDENSAYTNYASGNKNCYLLTDAHGCRDCIYGFGVHDSQSCIDVYNVVQCVKCYECVDCYRCESLLHAQDCVGCSDSLCIRDCLNCRDCIACQNLENRRYCYLNRQYDEHEFLQIRARSQDGSYGSLNKLRDEFEAFRVALPHRASHLVSCEDCSGDELTNCKRVKESFEVSDAEDLRYCSQIRLDASDCLDVHQFGHGATLLYECAGCGRNAVRLRFCANCHDQVGDLTYCSGCSTSSHLFGCVNMRNAKYCVLNKQLTPEEYALTVTSITQHMQRSGEWGEFFPPEISLFAYNETRAQEYFPLTPDRARAHGLRWRDEVIKERKSAGPELADSVFEVDDEVTKSILVCAATQRGFRILPRELAWYREMKVPLPRLCPDERLRHRMAMRSAHRVWSRPCACCRQEVSSAFAPSRPEIIYCEACYQREAHNRLIVSQEA